MIDKWLTIFVFQPDLILFRFSLLFELDSVQGFDFISIINSMKIRIDYCPVHESYRFYRASVC
jgi:hypothetical protein